MIAACPRCAARYRIDPTKIGPEGARLRCAKCEAVFRVRGPADPAPVEAVAQPRADAAPAPAPAPVAAPAASAATAAGGRAPQAGSETAVDHERLVVVADPEVDSGKATASAIATWGLQPILVHDGVEAMLTVQRMLPAAVVLDAALPKMFGFQVCEVIKRNESLREITVALVGAIHDKDRYRRPPTELYGADVYLERPDLPEGLLPILRQAGLPVPDACPTPAAAPTPAVREPVLAAATAPAAPASAPAAVPAATPSAAATAPAAAPSAAATAPAAAPSAPAPQDGLEQERARAERLARIIVSDILLYNPEKVEAALAAGNLAEALDGDLQEGRGLFMQRIDPRVRDEKDYLAEELRRVARERGGQ